LSLRPTHADRIYRQRRLSARLTQADRIYLELERLLDRHRRAGLPEREIMAIVERVWRASAALEGTRQQTSRPSR